MNRRMSAKTKRRPRRALKTARFQSHTMSVKIICVGLIALMIALGIKSISIHTRNETYKQQEAELKEQIKEQKQRAEEIEAYQEYVKKDDYIKDVAEDKLGLVDPNEILFKQTN